MYDLLKKIYYLNEDLFKNYLKRKTPNPKTGLSDYEKNRILKYPKLQAGETTLFEKPFSFSDNAGFLHSLEEIFETEIYKFQTQDEIPYIIDCGANFGLSILYFKKLYPNAKIIAFEPDKKIFETLKKNIQYFPNHEDIEIHETAVWTEDSQLKFYADGSLAGSIVTDYSERNLVEIIEAVDLKKYLTRKISFLKIDIEGAENKVIFDIAPHLHFVDKLFLEFHGLKNERQNLDKILSLLTSCGFEYYIRLAGDTMRFPFCNETPKAFNQQLNILCFRK